jgi:hypothetical protein
MKPSRFSWCVVLPAVVLVGACEREPTAPGFYTLSGHVKLTGYLVTPGGDFAGTKVVGDADGVPVDLLFGKQIVARAKTVDGVYTFHGIAPGGYIARTTMGPLEDETLPLTITHSDLAAGDTLRLVAQGDLLIVPNPFRSHTTIYFYLDDTTRVNLQVTDLSGNPVRQVVDNFTYYPDYGPDYGPPFTSRIAGWDGRDQNGRLVTGSMYWLKFEGVDPSQPLGVPDERIHLVFR